MVDWIHQSNIFLHHACHKIDPFVTWKDFHKQFWEDAFQTTFQLTLKAKTLSIGRREHRVKKDNIKTDLPTILA